MFSPGCQFMFFFSSYACLSKCNQTNSNVCKEKSHMTNEIEVTKKSSYSFFLIRVTVLLPRLWIKASVQIMNHRKKPFQQKSLIKRKQQFLPSYSGFIFPRFTYLRETLYSIWKLPVYIYLLISCELVRIKNQGDKNLF